MTTAASASSFAQGLEPHKVNWWGPWSFQQNGSQRTIWNRSSSLGSSSFLLSLLAGMFGSKVSRFELLCPPNDLNGRALQVLREASRNLSSFLIAFLLSQVLCLRSCLWNFPLLLTPLWLLFLNTVRIPLYLLHSTLWQRLQPSFARNHSGYRLLDTWMCAVSTKRELSLRKILY